MEIKIIWCLVNTIRTWAVYILLISSKERKKIIDEIDYWAKRNKCENIKSHFLKFTYLVSIYKEYRNLVFYRLKARGIICRVFAILTMVFLPRMDSLKLYADYIGWNLYIEHGIGTILSAKRIGDNCWVNQQVTIGYNLDGKSPIIGDGVRVCAGSKILGGIEIEDNAIIGAGAVVVKSVERMSIVVGVPAQKIGINSEHKLI